MTDPDPTPTTARRALILVDLQNDFMPGGPLGVPGGDQVIPLANALMDRFGLVVATQDWHPSGHESFASAHDGRGPGEQIELHGLAQVLWPDHCVQGSEGAELVEPLERGRLDAVFQKGQDRQVDSYSGFFDNGRRHDTGLAAWLRARGVEAVYIAGLALDYCVKWTALDSADLGFSTHLVRDATRPVELHPGDGAAAERALLDAGVRLVHSAEVTVDT